MDAIGNEVGQKMRSAIKAKLMELGCYVDDELPDYIMVMVANKRTRTQMESDLLLFLRTNTKAFVDWLQQVLKKLKEVRLTNPEMYACTSFGELKRKASIEMAECVIKKEKKDKKIKSEKEDDDDNSINKSLSDDIPVNATKLVENRHVKNRIVELSTENEGTKSSSIHNTVNEDSFDIPSITEVNLIDDSELETVTDKIQKTRTVLLKSDSEDEDFINIKADAEELLSNELCDISSSTNIVSNDNQSRNTRKQTISLVRQRNNISSTVKLAMETTKSSQSNQQNLPDLRHNLNNLKITSLKSLDTRSVENADSNSILHKKTISLTETLREEKEISGKIFNSVINKPVVKKGIILKRDGRGKKESVHNRLGLVSCIASVVSLPKKKEALQERMSPGPIIKTVPSMVQVKPRRPTLGFCQANKTLLLKAVAEAQRSVAQLPPRNYEEINTNKTHKEKAKVSENKRALFTKKYKEQHKRSSGRRNLSPEKNSDEIIAKKKPKNIIIEVQSNKNKGENIARTTGFNENSLESFSSAIKPDETENISPDESNYVASCVDINIAFDEDLDKYMDDVDSCNEPSSNSFAESNEEQEITETQTKHQFIVTLDGLKNKLPFKKTGSTSPTSTTNIGECPKQAKRPPSPIVFEKKENTPIIKPVRKIPEVLPKVVSVKERCKYWPACRLGESCEYMHPNLPCKVFPNCKFGDRCLYIHPKCKFYASCTRKDCPYSHGIPKSILKTVIKQHLPYHPLLHPQTQEICKFFPNCTNVKCSFYHPKPCRFGVACLNKAECGFSHNLPSKEKLTWHSVK